MADVVMVGVMVAFVALAAVYVAWCDRVVESAEKPEVDG